MLQHFATDPDLENGMIDSTPAQALLEGFGFERLIVDRGYAAADFVEYLLAQGIEAAIPPHQRTKILRAYDPMVVSRAPFGRMLH